MHFVAMNHKRFAIAFSRDFQNDVYTLYLAELNADGNFNRTPRKIMSLKGVYTHIEFTLNKEADKYLISYIKRQEDEVRINYVIINDDLKIFPEQSFSVKIGGYGVASKHVLFFEDQILLTVDVVQDNLKQQWKNDKKAHYLVHYNLKSNESLIKEFLQTDKYSSDYIINTDQDNNIYIAYMTLNGNPKGGAGIATSAGFLSVSFDEASFKNEFVVLKLDKNLKLIQSKTNPLPKEFMLKMISAKALEKQQGIDISDFRFRTFLPNDNGQVLIAGEYHTKSHLTDVRTNAALEEHFWHGDILAFICDLSTLDVIPARVPKTQLTTNDKGEYSGYYVFRKDNTYYFMFNDAADNVEKDINLIKKPQKFTSASHAVMTIVTVSATAQVARHSIEGNMSVKEVVLPTKCISSKQGAVFLYAIGLKSLQIRSNNASNGYYRLGKITL